MVDEPRPEFDSGAAAPSSIGQLVNYYHKHKWFRRTVAGSLVAIIGATGVLSYNCGIKNQHARDVPFYEQEKQQKEELQKKLSKLEKKLQGTTQTEEQQAKAKQAETQNDKKDEKPAEKKDNSTQTTQKQTDEKPTAEKQTEKTTEKRADEKKSTLFGIKPIAEYKTSESNGTFYLHPANALSIDNKFNVVVSIDKRTDAKNMQLLATVNDTQYTMTPSHFLEVRTGKGNLIGYKAVFSASSIEGLTDTNDKKIDAQKAQDIFKSMSELASKDGLNIVVKANSNDEQSASFSATLKKTYNAEQLSDLYQASQSLGKLSFDNNTITQKIKKTSSFNDVKAVLQVYNGDSSKTIEGKIENDTVTYNTASVGNLQGSHFDNVLYASDGTQLASVVYGSGDATANQNNTQETKQAAPRTEGAHSDNMNNVQTSIAQDGKVVQEAKDARVAQTYKIESNYANFPAEVNAFSAEHPAFAGALQQYMRTNPMGVPAGYNPQNLTRSFEFTFKQEGDRTYKSMRVGDQNIELK